MSEFPAESFNQSLLAVRQEIVRRAVKQITGTLRDLAYRHVSQAIDFSLTPTSGRSMNLAFGIDLSLEDGALVFRKQADCPVAPEWDRMELSVPGSAAIYRPDWTIQLAFGNASDLPPTDAHRNPWRVQINAEKIHPPLYLRKRVKGDRFFPAGMLGAVKLSDFLAAQHLPRADRDRWPLVCDQDGILWIPGFRLREGAAVSAEIGRLDRNSHRPFATNGSSWGRGRLLIVRANGCGGSN